VSFAPVGISAYARPDHLRRSITALQGDPVSARTEIFVFSDGSRPGDEAKVEAVRNYVRSLSGFRSVELIERQTNNRTFNNRDGMRSLLREYGKLIWLEEDIVIAPGFLRFMNTSLEVYRDNPRVFSICGYRPPIELPDSFEGDAFVLPRFSAWGFGTWEDRFDRIRMKIPQSEYYRFLLNPFKISRFCRGGWDMLPMLNAEVHGRIDALDVKIFYQQFLMGMNTVYPSRHLAANIGHDGTGIHCAATDRFDVQLQDSRDYDFRLPEVIEVDADILRANMLFRRIRNKGKLTFLLTAFRDMLRELTKSAA